MTSAVPEEDKKYLMDVFADVSDECLADIVLHHISLGALDYGPLFPAVHGLKGMHAGKPVLCFDLNEYQHMFLFLFRHYIQLTEHGLIVRGDYIKSLFPKVFGGLVLEMFALLALVFKFFHIAPLL